MVLMGKILVSLCRAGLSGAEKKSNTINEIRLNA
jgi:hypothetical protein